MIHTTYRLGIIPDTLYAFPSAEELSHLSSRVTWSRVTVRSHEPLKLPAAFHLKRMKTTVRIEVQRSDEALLQSYKKNTRNEIAKTYRDSTVSVSILDKAREGHYILYAAQERSAGRPVLPRRSFHVPQAHSFGCYESDVLRAGMTVYDYGTVWWTLAIYSARHAQGAETARIGHMSRRLVHEVCRAARNAGASYVDLAYINHKEVSKRGISAFKMQFGGVEVSEYVYIAEPMVWRMIRMFRTLISV